MSVVLNRLSLTVLDVSTTCVVITFRVKASSISVDGRYYVTLVIDLFGQKHWNVVGRL